MKPIPFLEMVLSRLPEAQITTSTLLALVRVATVDGIERPMIHPTKSIVSRAVSDGLVERCPDRLYRLTGRGTAILVGITRMDPK